MRMNKVYKGKNASLLVCFRGRHYASPRGTKVKLTQRVPILPGEEPDTVIVLGETWHVRPQEGAKKTKVQPRIEALKRSGNWNPQNALSGARFIGSFPGKQPLVSPEDNMRVLQRIKDVAPNPSAESLLAVCWDNWTRGVDVPLFQGLNYETPEINQRIRALGAELMKEFAQTVQ